MKRREFARVGVMASGALIVPVGCMSNSKPTLNGGDEKLFLNEQDFARIKDNISQFEWAKKRFDGLRKNALMTEDEYYQSHWKGNWRQWTTGQYLKYVAIYYRLSGEEKNLFQIKRCLKEEFRLDRMDKPLYNDQKNVSSSLWSWGMARINYFWAWDMVKSHPLLDDIKGPMMVRLREITRQYLRYEKENITRLGNTQFWSITTLGLLGFLTSNEEAIAHSVSGKYGLKTALENKVRDGRFWPETLQYTNDYVLCAMSLLAEASTLNDYDDLYAYVSPGGTSIKSLVDAMFELCNPNGLLMPNGDGAYCAELDKSGKLHKYQGFGARLFNDSQTRISNKFELFYKAYKDPKYAWVINMSKDRYCEDVTVWGDTTLTHGIPLESIEAPGFKSAGFQGFGHAVISTVEGKKYWEGKNSVLHVRNGNTVQFHGHDDPFHIDLYVHGKMVYPDWYLKSWDYLAPRKSRGNRNRTPISHYSLGHNTVLVDKKGPDQKRYQLGGKEKELNDILFSEIGPSDRMKSISLTGTIYKGVKQTRILGLSSDYLIDVFKCESNDQHTYDYVLHDEGTLVINTPIRRQEYDDFAEDYHLAPIDSEARSEGNQWLRKGTMRKTDAAWKATFASDSEKRVMLHVGSEAGTKIFETNTPLYSAAGWDNTPKNIREMSKPMLIIRRQCKSTRFVVVHQLRNLDRDYEVIFKKGSILIKGDTFADIINVNGNRLTLTSV